MTDLRDIAVSKNCQSDPNWHESFYEDKIFWIIIFKNHSLIKKNMKTISKKIRKFFWKKFISGKNILYCKIFEKYFSENEIIENCSMAVWIWSFLRQLQRPIIWCQTYEILQFQKTVNLIQTDMNQFSMIKFSEKWLQKSIFFQKFSKKMLEKKFFRKKNIKKKFSKKNSKK